jgi:molecular chaperone DnaK (HSP70)
MDTGFTVLVRHSKAGSTFELTPRPADTEDLPDAYLIPLVVAKGQHEGSIKVVEQTPSRMQLSIWDGPAVGLLEKLLVDASLGPDTKKKLAPIIEKRRALAKLDEQIAALTEQRNKLDQRANELRQNLAAIAKNPAAGAQRDKWTKQLDEFTSDGNKLGAQLADLEAKRLDLRTELENAIDELDITLPAKAKP